MTPTIDPVSLQSIKKILHEWDENRLDAGACVEAIYILDHQYDKLDAGVRGLKSRDLLVASALQKSCAEENFCFFLTTIKKLMTETKWEEMIEGELKYKHIIDTAGRRLVNEIDACEGHILLQADKFGSRWYDDEPDIKEDGDGEGETANTYEESVRVGRDDSVGFC